LFFSNTRKSQEEATDYQKYQSLINTDLWAPTSEFRKPNGVPAERIAAEAMASPSITEYPAYRVPMGRSTHDLSKLGLPPKSVSDKLDIPDIRVVDDYAQGWDDKITSRYNTAFKAGYILTIESEPEEEDLSESEPSPRHFSTPKPSTTPGRKTSTRSSSSKPRGGDRKSPSKRSLATVASSAIPTLLKSPKLGRIWQNFHPTRWTSAELEFVSVLARVLGPNWQLLSGYLGRTKSPAIVEKTWLRCDGDFSKVEPASFESLKCDACTESAQLSDLVYCDTCYRSYHLHCTYPVLEHIPESDWFCSPNCMALGTLNCKVCAKATDDDQILVCDKCDRGAHIYCLAVPLKEIPEGEWFCDECASAKGTISGKASSSTHKSKASLRLESRVKDLLQASSSCDHSHSAKQETQSEAQPSLLLPNNRLALGAPLTSLASVLVQHSVEIPWREIVCLSQLCVDCIVDADGGIFPSVLADFETGHALLPQTFKHSIFTHQLDDVPFTSMGETPDAAALNAHLDNLIAATERFAEQAFLKPLISKSTPPGFTPVLQAPSPTSSGSATIGALQLSKAHRKASTPHSAPTTPTGSLLPSNTPSSNIRSSKRLSEAASRSMTGPMKKTSSGPRSAVPRSLQSPSQPKKKVAFGSFGPNSKFNGCVEEWLAEGGYANTDHCYWIFQANPVFYDIRTSLKNLKEMTWVVRQNQSRIRSGDRIFIWESGKDSGIIALGTVTSHPTYMKEAAPMKAYAKDHTKFDRLDLRCQLVVEHVLPEKLLRSAIAADPTLTNLTILRAPIGTNFKVTKSESETMMKLLLDLNPSNYFRTTSPSAITTGEPSAQVSSTETTSPAAQPEAKGPNDHIDSTLAVVTATDAGSSTDTALSTSVAIAVESTSAIKDQSEDVKKETLVGAVLNGMDVSEPFASPTMPTSEYASSLSAYAKIEQDFSTDIEEDHEEEADGASDSGIQEEFDQADNRMNVDEEVHATEEDEEEDDRGPIVDDFDADNFASEGEAEIDSSDVENFTDDDDEEEEEEEEECYDIHKSHVGNETETDSEEENEIPTGTVTATSANAEPMNVDTHNTPSSSPPLVTSIKQEATSCESPGAETSVDSANTSLIVTGSTPIVTSGESTSVAPADPSSSHALALVFPMAFVVSSLANFKRLRLSSATATSSTIMSIGKRHTKSKASKIPLIEIQHMPVVQTFPSLTPAGFKIKPRSEIPPPHCPSCSVSVSKPAPIACAKCGKGFHLQCANRQAVKDTAVSSSSPHWICQPCSSQGSHSCPICTATVAPVALEFQSCDCCDEVYHLECVNRSTTNQSTPWLCKKCDLSKAGLMRAKLCLVLRELRLEVQRLSCTSFDIASLRIKKSIDAPEKAGNPVQILRDLSRSVESSVQTIITQATQRWLLWRANTQIHSSD
jgi:hypothetical protein